MTDQQKNYLLLRMHSLPVTERLEFIKHELGYFRVGDDELQGAVMLANESFINSIGQLNKNQLKNLIEHINESGLDVEFIKSRLRFYEIGKEYYAGIVEVFQGFVLSKKVIDVDQLDSSFRGIQFASHDNFNFIINQGWTGDWDFQPENLVTDKVQVASMNEEGDFPRGFYLNADIDHIEPVDYEGKIRYRVFIKNYYIINTGNRNIRFIAQPVRYIN